MTLLLRCLAIVVAAGLPVARWLPPPWGGRWMVLSLLLAVLPLLAFRAARPRFALLWPVVAALFVVAALASWPNAVDPESHLVVAVQLVVWAAAGPFALAGLRAHDPRGMGLALRAFLVVQSVSALAAVAQAAGSVVGGVAALYGRSPGLSGHQNILGMFCGVAMIVSLQALRTRRSAGGLLVLVVNSAALLASGSLTAAVAVVMGLVVLLVTTRVKLRTIIGIVTAATVALWVTTLASGETFKSPADRLLQVTGQTGQTSTLQIRIETVQYAWDRIVERPLSGWGLDDRSGATFDGLTLTHDVLMRGWYQGGLAGLLAFGLIFLACAGAVLQAMRRAEDAVPAAVLTVIWGFALTAATFQQGYFWLPLLGAIAYLTPSRGPMEQPSTLVRRPSAASSPY